MTESETCPYYEPPDGLKDRISFAFDAAMLDTGLLKKIIAEGHNKNEVIEMARNLAERLERGEISCAALRNEIRRAFPKGGNKCARKTILKYRNEMQNWINGVSQLTFPPNLDIQNLPRLASNTLRRYCRLYEKYRHNDNKPTPPNTSLTRAAVNAQGDIHEVFRYDVESANPGSVRNYEFDYPAFNLQQILIEYVNQSERNALEVLVYIISIGDTWRFHCYTGPILGEAMRRLSGNPCFIRSLLNLLDEVTNTQNLEDKIPMGVLPAILENLSSTGIMSGFDPEATINPEEARDFVQHTLRMNAVDTGQTFTYPMRIPSNFVPLHWNIMRIVNPAFNESFQEFAEVLEECTGLADEKSNEESQYLEELENNRRYGLEFSRVKVTEIPGTENMDIWFHYSRDPEMESGDMRVEIVVNDGSIVYFLNDGQLETRGRGICIPRISNDEFNNRHIDALYEHEVVRNWASPAAQRVLFFYIIKYAHALLVRPRSRGHVAESSSDIEQNPFNLRITEHSTETRMPGTHTGTGTGSGAYTITAYHGVDAFVRQLPQGHQASPEAIAEAERHHIFLAPGQTFVRAHTRGSEITEQGRKGRGISHDDT